MSSASIEPADLVAAGLYRDEREVQQIALRHLLQDRPELRIAAAVHRYQREPITVAKAASLAGISFERMKDELVSRGIQPRLGPTTLEEARAEVTAVESLFRADHP
jgi:predicted HTH domain antitoxin